MRTLSKQQKNDIKSLASQELSIRQIAKRLSLGVGTVHKYCKGFLNRKNMPAGRPRKLNERNIQYCVRKIVSGEEKSTKSLCKTLENQFSINVDPTTVQRALKRSGLKAGEKIKKPMLSKKNIKARLEFAKSHRDWTVEDWKRVVFSDESKINRFNSDGKSWTWFRDVSVPEPRTVQQTSKHGGGSVMIWGCITHLGPGYMCKIEGNMDQNLYLEILNRDLMDTIRYYKMKPANIIFQQDNDPKHTAKSVKEWLKNQIFETLAWPAQSPDLNPIENLWSQVKRSLNYFATPPKGMLELWERIEKIWNEISADQCLKLVESMPNRMESVIKAKGRWTKY